jgi:D-sedoheptulose 7-phosphate isomerase
VSTDGTDFLYPFIERDEHDAGGLMTDLVESAETKAGESRRLREVTLARYDADLHDIAVEVAARFGRDARLFTFGNGGSATDAAILATLHARPPWGVALPARCLAGDPAVITALANDVGFEVVFSRQLIAHGRPGDIAIGLSTSGNSTNLLRAFVEAHHRGMLTVGLAGYGGGLMATCPGLDACLVVESDSVHRIQEAQAAMGFELWTRVQSLLGADGR